MLEHLTDAVRLAAAERILRRQHRTDALLVMMGDKRLLFSASGQSFLMYAKYGRVWVALHDPVGRREEWRELVESFTLMAAAHRGLPSFYQVCAETLPLYEEAAFNVIKVGEEARIFLPDFVLKGARFSALRYALKRGRREGLTMQMAAGEQAVSLLPALRNISDQWLLRHGGREKGFSVAAFDPRNLATQSVALVRQDGAPVAFVAYMQTDLRSEAAIGVMRRLPGASPYAMEFLITSLAVALRAAGCDHLSLGIAPLAGLANQRPRSVWHAMGNLIWQHGGAFYNFKGVRGFKAKFHPVWLPRYLATRGPLGPLWALSGVALLTQGREWPEGHAAGRDKRSNLLDWPVSLAPLAPGDVVEGVKPAWASTPPECRPI